ncbi:MAG: hypothetical protein J7K75_10625 [Desulfuromonas sp.]|nr:hypothetical protein [Desulfuromonas sp.]
MLRSARVQLTLLTTLALAVSMTVGAGTFYLYPYRINTPSASHHLFAIATLCLAMLAIMASLFWFYSKRFFKPLLQLGENFDQINIDTLAQHTKDNSNFSELRLLTSQHNAMLDRLEGAVRRVRQFSGDASHELRTPLTILRGETEVALLWAKTPEEYRNTLQSNMEEIDRMGRILEDLLTLAKSESGDLPLSIRTLSLSDLLQELYLQGRALAETKQINVNLHHQPDALITVQGDDLRLRQLFLNLLTNAIRYTHEKGNVDIEVSRNGNMVTVSISDDGIGIAKEHLPHIFERFYRTDEARNRAHGGTGLGLAIVKGITEAHDGEIKVFSTPGKGSKFQVSLPADGPKPVGKGAAH